MLKLNDEGLIPGIVQDARTGQALMLGYLDAEALRRTLTSGEVWFYSRSRQELWHKGATSGSFLKLRAITADCDQDALLLQVEPTGPVCHTGAVSCFFNPVAEAAAEPGPAGPGIMTELFQVIQERGQTRPEGSYTARLLEGGVDRIGKKVVEEAAESIIAAKNAEPQAIAYEVADLLYHTLVLLAATGVPLEAVWEELRKRRR